MSDVGGPRPDLLNIGEEGTPPFAVLPDPFALFLARSKRFEALAPRNDLEPYLRFLANLASAQHDILPDLPRAVPPPSDRVAQALEHGMPPISRAYFEPDETVRATIGGFLDRLLASGELPPQTTAAVDAVRHADAQELQRLTDAALEDGAPADDLAQRSLVAAGLQVHFSRLAAMLSADDLKPIAPGACPSCGSAPVTSSVVGWPKAHNTRFCACSLCATMWNVVRIKCLVCGSMEGISFRTVDREAETVKAETCEGCRSYVKILYQVNDPTLEPVADDVASLGLDMLMAEEGWKRGGRNPFLLGY
jgi:FdhE protein